MSSGPRIVVGVDPSEECDDAIALARRFCEALDARPRLVLAHAPPHGLPDAVRFEQFIKAGAEHRLHLARVKMRPLDVETASVAFDSPGEALDHEAREAGASMIVVGSSRRTERGRVTPGGVGESLLHGAPCAVAVAPWRYASERSHPIHRVAVAFDGSAEGWHALEEAIDFVAHVDGSLLVLTAVEPGGAFSGHFGLGSGTGARTSEREHKEGMLDLAMRRIGLDCEVEGRLIEGEPAGAIADAGAECDLLLVGSRGHGPLGRALLGGVSNEILRTARSPVLVFPRGEATPFSGPGSAGWQAAATGTASTML